MNPAPYPYLLVRFLIGTEAREAVALLDTGFDGHLVVPESLIGTLSKPNERRRYQTASGESVVAAAYVGTVESVELPGPVAARITALGDEYLVGLRMMNHFRITFDHGKRVIVEP